VGLFAQDSDYVLGRRSADEHRLRAAQAAAADREYRAKKFPRVKIRCVEPFKLGPDTGYSPARFAEPGEIVEVPEDIAQWLCHPTIARAERIEV
jgi:hypothetical protein